MNLEQDKRSQSRGSGKLMWIIVGAIVLVLVASSLNGTVRGIG